jgi:hypothetical protein
MFFGCGQRPALGLRAHKNSCLGSGDAAFWGNRSRHKKGNSTMYYRSVMRRQQVQVLFRVDEVVQNILYYMPLGFGVLTVVIHIFPRGTF